MKPASQSKGADVVGAVGQPFPMCVQQKAFFAADQPAAQLTKPSLQALRRVELLSQFSAEGSTCECGL